MPLNTGMYFFHRGLLVFLNLFYLTTFSMIHPLRWFDIRYDSSFAKV